MSQWKNICSIVALSITASFAGTGCLAQDADDAASDPEIAAVDQQRDDVADVQADESTGETKQACCGGGFPFVGCASGCGFGGAFPFGFGGCGFPVWGGLTSGFPFGRCGFGCGFAGLGLGCGGFAGGCGGCF
ncbi:MAG: hypothetical protein QM820_05860 [Minicystis sp.]